MKEKRKKRIKKIIGISTVTLLLLISMMIFPVIQKIDYQTGSTAQKLTAITTASSDSEIQVLWSRIWGGVYNKFGGNSIWGNGSFLYTIGSIIEVEGTDFSLIKRDTDGNTLWNRTWGGADDDEGLSIWGDGSFLYTLGKTWSFGVGENDLALLKWDTDGNIIWNRTWGGMSYDGGDSIWGDGTFLYTLGYTRSFGAGKSDFALLKWDTDGNIIWNRTWGGVLSDGGLSIWGDGSFLYTLGYTQSFGAGGNDFALLKWDMDGNIFWNRTWGGVGTDTGHSVWGDGSFLYTLGTSYTLLKWDTDGNIIWNRTCGGAGRGVWGDGTDLYTFGSTYNPEVEGSNFALLKWDVDGNIIWNRTWNYYVYVNYGCSIWGDGTDLYTFGFTMDLESSDLVLLKWGIDTTVPALNGSGDIAYEEGTTGHNISWIASDDNPDSYVIYRDGLEIASGYWTSGIPMIVNVDGLTFETYNYTIIVWDVCDNSATATIIVTVEDTTAPIFLETSYSNNTQIITWIAEDRNPSSYTIYRDGEEIVSGDWASGGLISIKVEVPKRGYYDYTIVIKDSSGNTASDSVIILSPVSSAPPDNFFFLIVVIVIVIIITIIAIIIIIKKKRRSRIILIRTELTEEEQIA